MDFRLFSVKGPLLLAVAAVAASALEAQPAATNAWQHIIFSSADHTEISSNLTTTSPQSPPASGFQSLLHKFQDQAPVTSFDSLPAAPAPMPSQARRLRKSSTDKQNWAFMTPAEILGVKPNQMLQPQKHDANGDQNSLTPVENYLGGEGPFTRQADSSDNPSSVRDFGMDGDDQTMDGHDQTNDASSGLVSGNLGDLRSTIFNPSLNNAPDDNLSANPKGDSVWSTLFGSPSPPPAVPNPAQQQAEMDQFKQLLNPGFTPITPATPSPDGTISQSQTPLPSFDASTEPLANPIGASFAPLSSGIGKPASLAPLPTITGQISAPSVAPPAWAPQSPPWMSSMPQPFTVPQRKF
ncbi:MAG: hypothetical protein WBN22_02000 [Verrucomicrobiia bacterium]